MLLLIGIVKEEFNDNSKLKTQNTYLFHIPKNV